MADQRITDLAADPANANIARDDFVVIARGSVDYKARLAGALLLPSYNSSTDQNKTLQIDSAGNIVWAASASSSFSRLLQQTGPVSPVALGEDASQYADVRVIFRFGSDIFRQVDLGNGVPRGYSGDGELVAWLSGGSTALSFNGRSSPFDGTPTSVDIYVRRG